MADSREALTLLVVDDQEEVRVPVSELLGEVGGISLVGQACNGAEGVEMTRSLNPCVVLMDIRMPVMDGVEATRRITEECPDVAVLVHSAYGDESLIVEALQAGARGYVLKGSSATDLVSAVKSVGRGHSHISDEVARMVVERLVQTLGRERQTRIAAQEAADRLEKLNVRQQEFARQAAHELRSPLTGLLGNLEMLTDGQATDDEERRQLEAGALTSARRLQRLAANLEITAGGAGIELHSRRVEVAEVVDQIAKDMNLPGGTIDYVATNGCAVDADPERLAQVMGNLVRNALVAAPGKPVRVGVKHDADKVFIELSDKGPGFGAAQLAGPPEAFSKEPGTPAGMGAGLYVVHELVKRMGGDVVLGNDPSGGARVTISMPRPDR